MPQEIVMPRLSDTMEEGTLARWLKQEGDEVKKGDLLAEIETDKATMELQAYGDGVLSKILVQEGTTVPLGAPIGMLSKPGEAAEGGTPSETSAPPSSDEEPDEQDATRPSVDKSSRKRASGKVTANGTSPEARADQPGDEAPSDDREADGAAQVDATADAAEQRSQDEAPGPEAPPPASEPAPRASRSPGPESRDGDREPTASRDAEPTASTPKDAPADGEPLRASPVARRLAEEHDLNLDELAGQGSGPGGRIVQADVERFLEERRAIPVAASATAPPTTPPTAPPRAPATASATPDSELRQVSRVHQVMARRMLESVRDVPQYYLTAEIDMAAALDLRRQLQQSLGEEEGKVSINDLVLRAVALALREVPEVNSSWRDGQLLVHHRVHLGVAVAVSDGLLVPVVRDADTKTVRQIAAEVRDLAGRARDGKLTLQEMQSGTFSVTNLGMFDVEEFHGIVNPPEAGLLAIGTVADKPVVLEGEVVVRPRMRVSLTADHRAYSGDVGARFLQALKPLLQQPLRLGF